MRSILFILILKKNDGENSLIGFMKFIRDINRNVILLNIGINIKYFTGKLIKMEKVLKCV